MNQERPPSDDTSRPGANGGAVSTTWQEYRPGQSVRPDWSPVEAEVIEEALVTIYLNGQELATIMCTPRDQTALALGFLKNEGLIQGMGDVELTFVSKNGCCVDVWTTQPVVHPRRPIITSGCGGGVTFTDPSVGIEPLHDDLRLPAARLFTLFNQLHHPGSLHARTRGVHAAALSDGESILTLVEDVGRHNTIDKLLGLCLLRGISTEGRILLATGRVSSEMLRKGALMGCPIIASRNSPTSMSVAMAEAWNITLVGYVRQGSMRVYTHPERLGDYREVREERQSSWPNHCT
ncbi:MAG TPA: formate dehydrogenase accessory sulfurtransferase FdhD [Anaerolineales bacterium]|nr:formate dehydrogenase accessory sulfurtransferase FdhD [Anaerolineales bacterium]